MLSGERWRRLFASRIIIACCVASVLHGGEAARRRAVERGLEFINRVASNPKDFAEWGHDMLWCFYTISATAKDPRIRDTAYRMGRQRALEWRRLNTAPPHGDAGELSIFIFGTDAADRLGVRDDALKEKTRAIAARFTPVDFLDFDPAREPPPSDVPAPCPKCGFENPRGAKQCARDGVALKMRSRYDVFLDALVETYTGDAYGVKLGGSYEDVLKWIHVLRPYAPPGSVPLDEAADIIYAITHVVYTLNDYGRYRLSPSWLPQEFAYLRDNIALAFRQNDPETLGEFMDSLRAFGMSGDDPAIRRAEEYLLSRQNPDGSWGNMASKRAYTRYHTTWAAVDGLRDYAFQGERLRRPDLMPLLRSGLLQNLEQVAEIIRPGPQSLRCAAADDRDSLEGE